MTVNELIVALQALTPKQRELAVFFDGEGGCGPRPITKVYIAARRHVVTGEIHTLGVSVGEGEPEPEIITIEDGLR